ncbi:unnamed protein product [Lymnaea stagnalis]|uniref:Fibrinogen C-terminal domain-containing protein n=1 Tax=Lymnaea stagnalis TaxID=6523 RepID=A0AAV2I1S0_LYMST
MRPVPPAMKHPMFSACGSWVYALALLAQCHLLFGTLWANASRSHSSPHCSSTFHVWQPGLEAQQMIRDVYNKMDNLTSYTKYEIAEMKAVLAQETSRINNWTFAVDKRVFQLQIDNLDVELVQAKNSEGTAKLQMQVEHVDRRVDDLERWMYNVRNKLRSSRSSNGGSSIGDDSLGNIPQQQGISPDVGAMLKNSVGDLKAEWILLKRDLESVKKEGLQLLDVQRELRNDTSTLRASLNTTRAETRELEMKVYEYVDKQLKMEKKMERAIADTDHVKFQMEQHKMDIRQQEASISSLYTTTSDLQKNISDIQAKLTGSLGHRQPQLHVINPEDEISRERVHDDADVIVGGPPETDSKSAKVTSLPRDCHDVYTAGFTVSAVYQVLPENSPFLVPVYCEMINDTGYTLLQRRIDGTISFNRRWSEYKHGFGNPYGELWAGNELIHLLTTQKSYTLRIDFWTWEGSKHYAEYSRFYVESEKDNYKLLVGEYTGDAGDSLIYHDKMAFSTEDMDNDLHERHCAAENKGGWWYNSCFYSQLNGLYHTAWYSQSQSHYSDGIVWYTLKDSEFYSLKKVEMKIRPNKPRAEE